MACFSNPLRMTRQDSNHTLLHTAVLWLAPILLPGSHSSLPNPNDAMNLKLLWLGFLFSLSLLTPTLAQAPTEKMSVNDRLMKARAAKAEKRVGKAMGSMAILPSGPSSSTSQTNTPPTKTQKALPADYKFPVDKSQHGPNGEVIYTGARGAKYYINKNGNKTYLSSNM